MRLASWRRQAAAAAVPAVLALVLSGCVEYYANSVGNSSPAGTLAGGAAPAAPSDGGQARAGGTYTSTYGGGTGGRRSGYEVHRSHHFRQDFQDGDAELQRRARDRLGVVPLEQRTRENRLERQDEAIESRIDDAARRRAISPGGPSGGMIEPLQPVTRESQEAAANRRLERSTQAERQRQKEAAAIRRKLLSDQGGGYRPPPPQRPVPGSN